jgi:hypothetical protein
MVFWAVSDLNATELAEFVAAWRAKSYETVRQANDIKVFWFFSSEKNIFYRAARTSISPPSTGKFSICARCHSA